MKKKIRGKMVFGIAFLLGLLLALAAWRVVGKVSGGEVCLSCHSMEFAGEEYRNSSHYRSPSGVRAGCVECHVPGGMLRVLVFKQLIRDRYVELTNPIKTRTDWEERRPALAKRVREGLLSSNSAACVGCHREDAMVPQKDRGKKAHQDMKKTGESCIDCHYNLVHERVPWEGKAKKLEEGMLDL